MFDILMSPEKEGGDGLPAHVTVNLNLEPHLIQF